MTSSTPHSRPRSRASTQPPSRSRSSIVRITSVFVALFLLAPAVSHGAPSLDDKGAIQELLDRRAAAVLARDRDAFLATIDASSEAFAARQRRLFDWMA